MGSVSSKPEKSPKWKSIFPRKRKSKSASPPEGAVDDKEGTTESTTAKDSPETKIEDNFSLTPAGNQPESAVDPLFSPFAPLTVAESTSQNEESVERIDDLAEINARIEEMALDFKDASQTRAGGQVSSFPLEDWDAATLNDAVASLTRTAVLSSSIRDVLFNRERWIKDRFYFGTTISTSNSPISNQQSSGRCWLFACTNVLRHHISKSRQLSYSSSPGFQFSLSYLSFYDKLEKANYYLERMIESAQLSFDDRLVRNLNKSPMRDSGNWSNAVWLIRKYGLVPEDVFPESESSSSTKAMNQILDTKIREHGLRLRELDELIRQDSRFADSSDPDIQKKTDEGRLVILRQRKVKYLREIYNMLTICMGVPPTPDESFVWERYDKYKKYAYWTGTPIDFRKQYIDGDGGINSRDPLNTLLLVNDPRYEYGKVLVNERGRKYSGIDLPRHLNVQSEVMRDAVVKCLKADLPVAFTCDIEQFLKNSKGLLDVEIYHYEKAFGTKFGLTKGERLDTGDSYRSHDMLFTGTHIDEQEQVVRFRVENSWGKGSGSDGIYLMTPRWFDEFVYQVVIPRSIAEKELQFLIDSLSTAEKLVLPFWNPMA
ncbi:hypothetical protein CPB86DRAFT_727815 [Serendipita vermifera]|nr:hypothetical protein CPB86DRAFT_727815 [Serendipita vermifera]